MKIAHIKKKPSISEKTLNKIVNVLSSKNTESIILYGSQLTGNLSKDSDIDLLVVIKKLDKKMIEKLIENKKELEKSIHTKISLNIHTKDELDPLLKRKDLFIHKNRSEFLIYKYKYHYLCICGKNPFELFKNPSPKQIREEAIKLLLSFSYNLKKFILNPELAPHKEKEFIKMPLISLEYIAAFYGYISLDRFDALKYLKKINTLKEKHLKFIIKIANEEKITLNEKINSIKFIDHYRRVLIKEYLTFAQSDIRYVNKKVKFHWDLKYPQAVSMAIIEHKDKILLLKRTHDDYLYPNQWTLPGGYVENGETFKECIKRELFEETGLSKCEITPLFKNKEIKTKRVAIGCFLIVSKEDKIKISEHSDFNFVSINEFKKLNLTPECRKILTKHFNL